MKRTIILIIAAMGTLACNGAGEAGRFTLKGHLADYDGDMIYIRYGSFFDGINYTDSSEVKNGRFEFTGVIDEPYNASLTATARPDYNAPYISFYIEPGNLEFNGSWSDRENYTLTGSKTENEAKSLGLQTGPLRKKMNDLYERMGATENEAERERLQNELAEVRKQSDEAEMKFIASNPGSYVSAVNLRHKTTNMTLEEAEQAYYALTEDVRNSISGKAIADEIRVRKSVLPGQPAPEITGTDINGKPFSLHGLKGKYIILDFWASWCVPCREGNPHLKALWEKYHDKGLEVVCVSDDDSKPENWHKAVEQDGLENFHHILRGLKRTEDGGFDRSEDRSAKYDVHYLPTKYLIGADGNIIAGKINEGELDAKLEEIFGY